jgi:hypothetical protein
MLYFKPGRIKCTRNLWTSLGAGVLVYRVRILQLL